MWVRWGGVRRAVLPPHALTLFSTMPFTWGPTQPTAQVSDCAEAQLLLAHPCGLEEAGHVLDALGRGGAPAVEGHGPDERGAAEAALNRAVDIVPEVKDPEAERGDDGRGGG